MSTRTRSRGYGRANACRDAARAREAGYRAEVVEGPLWVRIYLRGEFYVNYMPRAKRVQFPGQGEYELDRGRGIVWLLANMDAVEETVTGVDPHIGCSTWPNCYEGGCGD